MSKNAIWTSFQSNEGAVNKTDFPVKMYVMLSSHAGKAPIHAHNMEPTQENSKQLRNFCILLEPMKFCHIEILTWNIHLNTEINIPLFHCQSLSIAIKLYIGMG